MALAKDITLDARTKLLSLLSRTLADSATQREIDLDAVKAHPVDLARIIVAAMDGIKDAQGASSNLENGTKLLMRLLQAGRLIAEESFIRSQAVTRLWFVVYGR